MGTVNNVIFNADKLLTEKGILKGYLPPLMLVIRLLPLSGSQHNNQPKTLIFIHVLAKARILAQHNTIDRLTYTLISS